MISLLVVNYRSADLAIEAIRSARATTTSPLQVVVVDNSVDLSESARLQPHCDVLVASAANVGYAAAINAGRSKCTAAVIIASNPDVVFGQGAIDRLAAAVAEGAAVAGPTLHWDASGQWLLPPSELHTAVETLDEALATRSRAWHAWRDRRLVMARLRFWSLQEPVVAEALSGAVMAISASEFDAVGGFDERFNLYFEENDFLRRVAARNKRIVYLPAARCRHLYNQSAGTESDRAASLYAESEMRYLEKWYGGAVSNTLKRMARQTRFPDPPLLSGPIHLPEGRLLVEASPLRTFATAAGHFPKGDSVDLPDEIWRTYRGKALYLRVVSRSTGRTLATYARYKSD